MLYACTTCGKTREIGAADAWPDACVGCGGTAWTSAPPAGHERSSVPFSVIDTAGQANALLRQPGSPRFPSLHT